MKIYNPDYLPDFSSENVDRFQQSMVSWYRQHHRKLPWRETTNAYFIWISEVMLQQTQVRTVLDYYSRFIRKFPTVRKLAQASLDDVLKSWELLGYYARARNLHLAAQIVVKIHDGNVPADYHSFRNLPGVGDYIAAAVLSIAFNQPFAVVDGNVKRVISRLTLNKSPVNHQGSSSSFQETANSLLDPLHPGEFNEAMMELGATICKPLLPKCTECPITGFCRAFREEKQAFFPVKVKKMKIPEYRVAIGIIKKSDTFLLTRRPLNGLLGGLWEFPGGKIREGESLEETCLREVKEEVNLSVKIQKHLAQVKHAYTHFKVIIDAFLCNHPRGKIRLKGPIDSRWVKLSEITEYPVPSANHKIIKHLFKYLGEGE